MRVNGVEIALSTPQTLAEFLTAQGYRVDRIAVLLGDRIIPKEEFPKTQLCDSDVLEVLTFMGGG